MLRKIEYLHFIGIIVFISVCLHPQSNVRDKWHQTEKVMDAVGIKPGMVIGKVGTGHGYFTFHLSRRVGDSGKIYANDIVESMLDYVRRRYGKFFFFTNKNDPERLTA